MATVNCKQQKQTQHDCFTFAADGERTVGCEPICRHRAQLRLFPSGREGGVLHVDMFAHNKTGVFFCQIAHGLVGGMFSLPRLSEIA
jgi:hypothetical protein